MEPKKVVRKKKTVKKHLVIFQDHEGNVLKTEFVSDGEAAEAPQMQEILEEKKHHRVTFTGWDQEITKVHANLVCKPIYEEVPKTYLIMYFHENGKILGTESVPYGEDAKIPYTPEKEENEECRYIFSGWSCELTKIDSDRMAKARFTPERKQYLVSFYNAENVLLKQELVHYKEAAQAPEQVEKPADKTYRYHFAGWDTSFSEIIGPTEVHARFEKEYIEYAVTFFDGETPIETKMYHYNDPILYPNVQKKGYDFHWENPVENVQDSIDLHGNWQFSNPKGKKIEADGSVYEIMNPSISRGSVRCIQYVSQHKTIELPEKVKLGDYYYRIESIHKHAFSQCPNVRRIICSDTVKILEDECFAKNKQLQQINLGKGIQKVGKNVFAACGHLEKIFMKGKERVSFHKNAFAGANSRIRLCVPANVRHQYQKELANVIQEKGLLLENQR